MSEDLDLARRAYEAGLLAGDRIMQAVTLGLLGPKMEAELLAQILFDDEDVAFVEELARHGNDLAVKYLGQRRHRIIEGLCESE